MVWHKRFIPSLITGISIAIITFFFEITASNIVMFASLGASAAILTHKYINRLNILRTVIISYLIALTFSVIIYIVNLYYPMPFPINALLAVTLTTLSLYLFNVFHPPAISASLAFLLLHGSLINRFLVFGSVLVLLIIVKVLTYAFYYEHLEMHKLYLEFKKLEKKEMKNLFQK